VLLEGENEMEEGQMKEIEIKEGHEDVVEKQHKKVRMTAINVRMITIFIYRYYIVNFYKYFVTKSLYMFRWQ
jgi:hypothetical protein